MEAKSARRLKRVSIERGRNDEWEREAETLKRVLDEWEREAESLKLDERRVREGSESDEGTGVKAWSEVKVWTLKSEDKY